MPKISEFRGMSIYMNWDDHPWPHFHVRSAEYRASFDLRSMRVTRGELPDSRARALLRWARMHESELWENWQLVENHEAPNQVRPLRNSR